MQQTTSIYIRSHKHVKHMNTDREMPLSSR